MRHPELAHTVDFLQINALMASRLLLSDGHEQIEKMQLVIDEIGALCDIGMDCPSLMIFLCRLMH